MTSKRSASQNLAAFGRGRGGRSSFSGVVASVFGCSGFIGRSVVNHLGKVGSQVICPYRCDPYNVRDLKVMGDLGQILYTPFHLMDDDSIMKAMKHSNVVVNLIGRDFETRNFSFQQVHVEGAARIARLAREAGVERFVHFSAMNASLRPDEKLCKGGSSFLRSKAEGERAVLEQFPTATIVRPADVYGQNDHFLTMYANLRWRAWKMLTTRSVALPLWRGGKETFKQPTYLSDVAKAVVAAIKAPGTAGRVIELAGPDRMRLDHLVDFHLQTMRYEPYQYTFEPWLGLNNPLFALKMQALKLIRPHKRQVSWERLDRECYSDTLTADSLRYENLNIVPERLEDRLHFEIKHFRRFGYYWASLGEFPTPAPPPYV